MNWDIYAENMNKVILTAIEHGGDAGGAYFSCPSKLEYAMKELLGMTADFANYYKVDDVYIKEFSTNVPQFIKL